MVLVGSTSRFLRNPGNLKVNLALPFSLLHGDGRGGGAMSDSGDDTRALVSLEQNIANLERSMSASQLGRGKGDLTSLLSRQVHCSEKLL